TKKAALAIAHNILVIVYHLLATGSCYEEARYDHGHPQQEARERQRAIKALERLGYTVTVDPAPSLPGGRLISASSVIAWPCVPKQRQSLSGSGVSTQRQLFRRNGYAFAGTERHENGDLPCATLSPFLSGRMGPQGLVLRSCRIGATSSC